MAPEQLSVQPPVTARQQLVWQLLSTAVDEVRPPAGPARVLDCGGGSGSFAVPLARAGAHVTVVDISIDALATLGRRAAEAGVGDQVSGVQGDIESLPEAVADGGFDLVLAHGIVEAVDDRAAAVAAIARATRPGGLVSMLLGNPAAAVLGRALAGDLASARIALGLLADTDSVDDIAALAAACGLDERARHGIGVFSDIVPGSALDTPGAYRQLAALDAEAATTAPFTDIAARVHLLLRRPGG